MQQLDVINAMLGTMGETPLNTLSEPHVFRGALFSYFDTHNRQVQSRGWWFNTENLELHPSPVDNFVYLPGDCLAVISPDNTLTKRNGRLYSLTRGSYEFTQAAIQVRIIREIPFEDLPEEAAQHISAICQLRFQTVYDGDSTKTRQLQEVAFGSDGTRAALWAADIRNRNVNFLESNHRLQNLKNLTRRARSPFRR